MIHYWNIYLHIANVAYESDTSNLGWEIHSIACLFSDIWTRLLFCYCPIIITNSQISHPAELSQSSMVSEVPFHY